MANVSVLAELHDKLNKRRKNSDHESPITTSGGNSPKLRPRPPTKNRSESLSDIQKYRITPKMTIAPSPPPKDTKPSLTKSKPSSDNSKDEMLSQSLSVSSANRIVTDLPPEPVAISDEPVGRQIRPYSKSLPKGRVRGVVGPPPTKPPPQLTPSQKKAVKEKKEVARTVSEKPSPQPPLARKGGAKKGLLKKFQKKRTNKVSETPNKTDLSRVGVETTGVKKGYQNIFDFESRESFPIQKSESFNRAPKKPVPLPRTNSISSSSTYRTSDVESGQDTPPPVRIDQSRVSKSVTSGRKISKESPPVSANKTADKSKTSQTSEKSNSKNLTAESTGKQKRKISVKRLDGLVVARRPMRRRTTKKEAQHLRNGVCSDSETKPYESEDENDDYIQMNPIFNHMTLSVPGHTHNVDPRASGYYLKILPSDFPNNDHPKTDQPRRRAVSEEPMFYGEFRRSFSVDSDLTLLEPSKLEPVSSLTLSEPIEHRDVPDLAIGDPGTLSRLQESTPLSPDYIQMSGSWFTGISEVKGQVSRSNSVDRDVPSSWIVAHDNKPHPPGLLISNSAADSTTTPVAMGNQDPLEFPPNSKHKTMTSSLGEFPSSKSPLMKRTSNSLGPKGTLGIKPTRVLQYSDVTIHPVGPPSDPIRLPRKPSKPQKYKYQVVNLKQDANSDPHSSHISQPLPIPDKVPLSPPSHAQLTPSQGHTEQPERIYYQTTSSLLGSHPNTITAPPLTSSLPGRPTFHHKYVEIDTEEMLSMSQIEPSRPIRLETVQSHDDFSSSSETSFEAYHETPPTVPNRPENLDDLANARVNCRLHVMSGDYSYVKHDKMLWVVSGTHRKIVQQNSCQIEQVSGQSADSKVPPPSVQPKTASLLRQIGHAPFQDSAPEPYLYPVFVKNLSKIEASQSDANKTANLRKVPKKGPPVPPYKPKEIKTPLKGKFPSAPSLVAMGTVSDGNLLQHDQHRSKVNNTSEFNVTMSFPLSNQSTPTHSNKSTSSHSSMSTPSLGVFSPPPASPPPVLISDNEHLTTPTLSERGGSSSSLSGNSSSNNNFTSEVFGPQPAATAVDISNDPETGSSQPCRCDLQSHMDDHSLAVIYHNKGEIVRRLSQRKETCSEPGTESERDGMELKQDGMESGPTVRTLDEVVSELDVILRNRLCSESDLIKAIESQLNIKLGQNTQLSPSEGSKKEDDGNEDSEYDDVITMKRAGLTSGRSHSYENLREWVDQTTENNVRDETRSGTIVYRHDETSTPPPHRTSQSHLIPSTGQIVHARTQSSPVQSSWQPRASHPRTLSSPINPLNRVTEDGSMNDDRRDNSDGYYGNDNIHDNNNRHGDSSFLPLMRSGRSYSNGFEQSPLKRTNAKRRPSAPCAEVGLASLFSDGRGVFTHRGGLLTKMGSGVEIEIPEGAVPRGRRQELWFDVIQTTFDPISSEDNVRSWSGSSNGDDLPSHMTDKKDRRIQLSPMILIGPSDVVLNQPIKIKLPHCLPYRNNSWHLQVFGRTQRTSNNDWTEISNTIGLVDLSRRTKSFFRKTAYQMHLDYALITTAEMGYFKLTGRPIRNGVHSAKQMLASIFTSTAAAKEGHVQLDVFVTDALTCDVQSLQHTLTTHNYQCLQRNIPVLCFGNGKDIEMMISSQSVPLETVVIPFGQFWRQKVIGQSHASFQIEPTLLGKSRTLTLKVQQAGAKLVHETNFLVP